MASHVQADILIKNGTVIDPTNGINKRTNVAIKDGKILHVGDELNAAAKEVVDARGCIVTPGLVDLHIHGYEYATPLGINPDKQCLARGITTVVDAGSAGAATLMGLRKYIVEPSKTSVFAFIHIASHGLAAAGCAKGFGIGGESDCLNQVDTEMCIKAIENNRDLVVGVKVRLTANVANDGANEEEIYRRAKEASKRTGTRLMIHHTFSTIPIQKQEGKMCCPGDMSPGDIYTHSFHASPSSITDANNQVYPEVVQAQKDGVLFDLGHGQGSFSWKIAETCAKSGFWPNIVSTDLHSGNINGPSYDLPSVMTKMLHIGMPLEEVIRATTETPASVLNDSKLNRHFGSLSPGRDADVTLLRLEAVDYDLEDCEGETRRIKQQLVPVKVWKHGEEQAIEIQQKFKIK